MLHLENVRKSFHGPHGPIVAVRDVSLRVAPGEFVALRGPSGSGKSTLLLMAGGLLRPDAGTVAVAGQSVYALGPAARAALRARHIGFVFQQFHLVPYLNVLENVLTADLALPGANAAQRARELLTQFGLSHRLDHLPSQLSSGERQRCALARALLHRPGLVLADEPTGNLDTENGQVVLDYLSAFVKNGGALLLATHDARAAEKADRLIEWSKTPLAV